MFVLQLDGRKHWRVHAPVHVDPLRSQPWTRRGAAVAARARDDEPVIDRVLERGDVMYLLRGWRHSATARESVSAHLPIGVHVVTRYGLVESILKLVSSDERLRVSLPLGIDLSDPEQLAPHFETRQAAPVDAIAAVPAEAVSRGTNGRTWSGGRPAPVGPVALAAVLHNLGAGDTVRRLLREGVLVPAGA